MIPNEQSQQQTQVAINNNSAKAKGVSSLVLGILSLICLFTGVGAIFSIIMSIVGLVLGSQARSLLIPSERGIATAGWICSIVGLCISSAMLLALMGLLGFIGLLFE